MRSAFYLVLQGRNTEVHVEQRFEEGQPRVGHCASPAPSVSSRKMLSRYSIFSARARSSSMVLTAISLPCWMMPMRSQSLSATSRMRREKTVLPLSSAAASSL